MSDNVVSKYGNWCFTPSQPVRFYQGDGECCKAHWIYVHRRIALWKIYLLLLYMKNVTDTRDRNQKYETHNRHQTHTFRHERRHGYHRHEKHNWQQRHILNTRDATDTRDRREKQSRRHTTGHGRRQRQQRRTYIRRDTKDARDVTDIRGRRGRRHRHWRQTDLSGTRGRNLIHQRQISETDVSHRDTWDRHQRQPLIPTTESDFRDTGDRQTDIRGTRGRHLIQQRQISDRRQPQRHKRQT